jgi:hypothetical protein
MLILETELDRKLTVLLRDYGYRFAATNTHNKGGGDLIEIGIRGYTSTRVVRYFRSMFAACEYLIPLLRDDEYSRRWHSIIKD